jgi:hypothetical protein
LYFFLVLFSRAIINIRMIYAGSSLQSNSYFLLCFFVFLFFFLFVLFSFVVCHLSFVVCCFIVCHLFICRTSISSSLPNILFFFFLPNMKGNSTFTNIHEITGQFGPLDSYKTNIIHFFRGEFSW